MTEVCCNEKKIRQKRLCRWADYYESYICKPSAKQIEALVL